MQEALTTVKPGAQLTEVGLEMVCTTDVQARRAPCGAGADAEVKLRVVMMNATEEAATVIMHTRRMLFNTVVRPFA